MGYAPANCFQPPKTVLASFRGVDRTFKMQDYEYFREKAWQAKHALESYMKEVKYRLVGWSLFIIHCLTIRMNMWNHFQMRYESHENKPKM